MIKSHFYVVPPVVHSSAKKLNFGQKLIIRTIHHTILKSRHPQETNDPCYVFVPQEESKKILACVLIVTKINTWLQHNIFTSVCPFPKLAVMATL